MTICSKTQEAVIKRLDAKKQWYDSLTELQKKEYRDNIKNNERSGALAEVGAELCDAVVDPRGKALRILRLVKKEQADRYLRDNAEWLGYSEYNAREGNNQYSVQKNSRDSKQAFEDQMAMEDARSNGMKVESYRPIESFQSIGSIQDDFEPGEVIYEHTDITPQTLLSCPIFYPKQSQIELCPCGCGFGRCDIDEKWYSANVIKMMEK